MFIILICAVWLLINLKKRKSKKKPLIWLCVSFGLFVVAVAITPAPVTTNNNYIITEPSATELPSQPAETPPSDAAETSAATQVEGNMGKGTVIKPSDIEPLEKTLPIKLIKATVARVIDGDTIEVRLYDGTEELIRMIGIDTPESTAQHEPF